MFLAVVMLCLGALLAAIGIVMHLSDVCPRCGSHRFDEFNNCRRCGENCEER